METKTKFKEGSAPTSQSGLPTGQGGFTLIELLVVIAIMGLLSTLMIVNLGTQRGARNIGIAENELVSNIRKAQSNTLSSRLLPSGESAQFYILKFDLSRPTEYKIQAMYNVSSVPKLVDIETINLPPNIQFESVSGSTITINRPSIPTIQNINGPTGCALVVFAAPFAKTLLNTGCTPVALPPGPYTIANTDDYQKILNFVANGDCDAFNNPFGCTVSTDSTMTIVLSDREHSVSKTVTVNAITGSVIFSDNTEVPSKDSLKLNSSYVSIVTNYNSLWPNILKNIYGG
ncbi:MAG TPA: prepilin-type N-terminal cleavage/methylation domain-containing protein [Candidatus Limnocylindria bacterium]|nr:prepilin-type N-terminal cleavage/methylation domain-containing protein [Candidatus Limnocylindria bacterium]